MTKETLKTEKQELEAIYLELRAYICDLNQIDMFKTNTEDGE